MSEQSFEAFLADWVASARHKLDGRFDPDNFDAVCRQRAQHLSDAALKASFRSDLARLARGYGGDVTTLVRVLLTAYADLPQRQPALAELH